MDFDAIRRKHDDDELRRKTKSEEVRKQIDEFAAYIKTNVKRGYSIRTDRPSEWDTTYILENPEETKKGSDPTRFGYWRFSELFVF